MTGRRDIEASIREAIEADETRFMFDLVAHRIDPENVAEPAPMAPIDAETAVHATGHQR